MCSVKSMNSFGLLVIQAVTSSSALLLLRKSLPTIQSLKFQAGLANISMFVGGGILYVASFLLWMYILSKAQVTYAYPVSVALTILFTTLGATLVLREQFTWLMFLGIFLVICGIAALTIKTAQ